MYIQTCKKSIGKYKNVYKIMQVMKSNKKFGVLPLKGTMQENGNVG